MNIIELGTAVIGTLKAIPHNNMLLIVRLKICVSVDVK